MNIIDREPKLGAIESCLLEIKNFEKAMDGATQAGSASVEIGGVEVQILDPNHNGRQFNTIGKIDSAL
jgi:hypothetical protein